MPASDKTERYLKIGGGGLVGNAGSGGNSNPKDILYLLLTDEHYVDVFGMQTK